MSRMRSEVTSRSNWAKDSSTLSVNRPIEVVVLNCWVTENKGDIISIEQFDQLGEIGKRSREAVDLVDHDDVDLPASDFFQKLLQVRTIG